MFDKQTTGFVSHFVRRYSRKTALLAFLLVLSGLAEGMGVVTLLPLVELAMADPTGSLSPITAVVSEVLSDLGMTPRLEILLAMIVLGMVLKGVFYLLAMKQVGYTVAHVATDLRLTFIRALLRTRWSYFVGQPTGRLSNAMGGEASRAASSYRALCALLASAIQVLIYGSIALIISWRIALFALFGGVMVMLALSRLVQIGRAAGAMQTKLMKSLITRLTDALQGIKPIKAMGREAHLQPLLEAETRGINRTQEQAVLASETLRAAQEPLLTLLLAIALYFALAVGNLSFPTVLMMAFLFHRLAGRITTLQMNYQAVVVGESAFWSMHENILAAETERERSPAAARSPTLEKEILFQDVSFSYGDNRVLDGVSLRIPAGAFVALLGPSGAGKTTLVDILVGLYSPEEGQVRVDGIPLNRLQMSAWRQMIGYVPQEMFLFHDTVYQNVALGDPAISREDVRDALRAAGAWDFVATLPDEVDTVMGERGSKLSGGQRQRVALARALARKPMLLILDEVTTSLDPATEAAICETLLCLPGNVTVVSISHQPAMMDAADLVYRIEEGQVREEFGPASLAATQGQGG